MKRIGTLLPMAMVALVIGLSGCTFLDHGIVKVEPTSGHMSDTFTYYYIFKSFEPTTVTVTSIDYETYHNGYYYGGGTRLPGDSGWITGTVPPFQEIVIYTGGGKPVAPGKWEHQVVFHTSEGDFLASGGWEVLP